MEGKQASNAWRVMALLFLANLFNFYDRTVPAVLIEPVRREWGLTDTQLGLITAAFTLIYAVAGVPLGRLADTGSRKTIMGVGLVLWSLLTGATGAAWSFGSFLVIRMLVGIGEASYAPSASSLIGDLFPAEKRARAIGIQMLGLPIGLVLAFFTTGLIAEHFGSWRAPFYVAAVPGCILAISMFFIREPARGAAETVKATEHKIDRPILRVLRTPTLWWIILAGIMYNMGSYAANGFLVPVLQRYFHLPLQSAGMATGVIVGVTGLIGLTAGGWLADRMHRINERARLIYGAVSMFASAALIYFALQSGEGEITMFVVLYAIGWLMQYNFYCCAYPSVLDVIEPRLRATAMAIFFALLYILGGALGPLVVGAISDHASHAAMVAAGASEMTDQFRGLGLLHAMEMVPIVFCVCGIGFLGALRTFSKDAQAMQRSLAAAAA